MVLHEYSIKSHYQFDGKNAFKTYIFGTILFSLLLSLHSIFVMIRIFHLPYCNMYTLWLISVKYLHLECFFIEWLSGATHVECLQAGEDHQTGGKDGCNKPSHSRICVSLKSSTLFNRYVTFLLNRTVYLVRASKICFYFEQYYFSWKRPFA